MGEIAEEILDGFRCKECGEPLADFETPGYPRTCHECRTHLHEDGEKS